MQFKESPYYDEEFLGKYLYQKITDDNEILTVQEFFRINDTQKEYHLKDKNKDYNLKIYEEYYELHSKNFYVNLFLVFDKPVHVTSKYCSRVVAPEIIIKDNMNIAINTCVANKVLINNGYENNYEIYNSKFHNVYFYNKKVDFFNSEINNFFIFNEKLKFYRGSVFLDFYYKIKFFGKSKDLKENILKYKDFKRGIIHIE